MKKILSFIITVILLFSCLGLTAFADGPSITISEDYQKIYMDGNSFSRANLSNWDIEYYKEIVNRVELSATQTESIEDVYLEITENEMVIYAKISFTDGSLLSAGFLRDDAFDEYNKIMNGDVENYIIDFYWPEENSVTAPKELLFGEQVTLDEDTLGWCDFYNVHAQNSDGSMSLKKGELLIHDGNYYYVDFDEIGIKDIEKFSIYDLKELQVHKIADTEFLKDIQFAEEQYYDDDLGFFYDDSFTESLSAIFMVFVFAVIPLALFVVFLISAIRSKTVYKKLFSTICILSVAVLAVFAVITILIMTTR